MNSSISQSSQQQPKSIKDLGVANNSVSSEDSIGIAKAFGRTDEYNNLEFRMQLLLGGGNGDRTRREHSGQVVATSSKIAKALGLSAESMALMKTHALLHEIGIPPFGKAGERFLQGVYKSEGITSTFDDKANAMRVLTRPDMLEKLLPSKELARQIALGIWRFDDLGDNPPSAEFHRNWMSRSYSSVPSGFEQFLGGENTAKQTLKGWADVEGQAVVWADVLNWYEDISDGLKNKAMSVDALRNGPALFKQAAAAHPDLFDTLDNQLTQWHAKLAHDGKGTPEEKELRYALDKSIRLLINIVQEPLIEDIRQESSRRLAKYKPQHAEDVRNMPCMLVSMSEEGFKNWENLVQFFGKELYPKLGQNAKVEGSDKTYIQEILSQAYDLTRRAVEKNNPALPSKEITLKAVDSICSMREYEVLDMVRQTKPDLIASYEASLSLLNEQIRKPKTDISRNR
jgi:dGTP triphosphohydrolase